MNFDVVLHNNEAKLSEDLRFSAVGCSEINPPIQLISHNNDAIPAILWQNHCSPTFITPKIY